MWKKYKILFLVFRILFLIARDTWSHLRLAFFHAPCLVVVIVLVFDSFAG